MQKLESSLQNMVLVLVGVAFIVGCLLYTSSPKLGELVPNLLVIVWLDRSTILANTTLIAVSYTHLNGLHVSAAC